MAHDVAGAQLHERDAVDALQAAHRVAEARRHVAGQVDLRRVAGDDHARPFAEARQEHQHLRDRRVLRLVEDHERAVQRAAAHVGERTHLDHFALEPAHARARIEQVLQRVVHRAQVGIDLLLVVTRQEAELLAGLDGRTHEHETAHEATTHRLDGLRNGEVGLAGAGRPHREHDVVLLHRREVDLLARGARTHDVVRAQPFAVRLRAGVGRIVDFLGPRRAQPVRDFLGREALARAQHQEALFEHLLHEVDVGRLAEQPQAAVADQHGHAVQFADQACVAVERTEQRARFLGRQDGNLDVGVGHEVTLGW